ncbi:cytidyltransferase-related domain protein [Bengtsoniella intestinalis]|uniref:cytidyltransferase-related domain protein n=1 Tax=Bengtsoniella intestinalis TaxID=3073143 RepID=UPI00391F2754
MDNMGERIERALNALGFLFRLQGGDHPQLDWQTMVTPLLPSEGRISAVAVIDAIGTGLSVLAPEPQAGWAEACFTMSKELMYPQESSALTVQQQDAALFGLQILQVMLDIERESADFDPLVDFVFCSPEELLHSGVAKDYKAFLTVYREEYVYELLRLGDELTPWRTLGHIAGVHHVAMEAARVLAAGGGTVDLGLISGAAAGHDFGKFGCQKGEAVPYLHYYYTHQWFARQDLLQIGHIAANHSTWDLELENLSAESLLLVYADFRSKQYYLDGVEYVKVYSLTEAFGVILNKLDNVDEEKRLRYCFVYAKMMDFQQYLQSFGFDAQDNAPAPDLMADSHVALMNPEQTLAYFRHTTVEHNLQLMHQLTRQKLFVSTLESARGEKNYGKLRAYVSIFQEYHSYLSPAQKEQTLAFLFELLLCPDGDVRRRAAHTMGQILARFVSGYKKERPVHAPPSVEGNRPFELWDLYLHKLVEPDYKLTPRQMSLIRYQAKTVTQSLLSSCSPQDFPRFSDILLSCFDHPEQSNPNTAFGLLDAIHGLPLACMDGKTLEPLVPFALYWQAEDEDPAQQIAVLKLFEQIHPYLNQEQRDSVEACVEQIQWNNVIPLLYLQAKLSRELGFPRRDLEEILHRNQTIRTVFLDNLKAATHWIIKAVGVEYLASQGQQSGEAITLHIATHFSNLLRVSQHLVVRMLAGQALLALIPRLTPEQRNEIAVELCKALEGEQSEMTQCISPCLGQLILQLPQQELDEVIADLEKILPSQGTNAVCAALSTIGTTLAHLSRSPYNTPERQRVLLGLLFKGLASEQKAVRQECLRVLGEDLFGENGLPEADKATLFPMSLKKILFLMGEHKNGQTGLFYTTAALRSLYHYVVSYTLQGEEFTFVEPEKVAFFPGTFDPFSLSHKGIVEAICAQGLGVYLAVDEFSWSKKTQPSLVRRHIISLSVADMFNVYIYPHDLPVNLATPADLERLKETFAPCPVYLAMGSDVVLNASSYRLPPVEHSVHHLNHLVFRRDGVKEEYPSILGDVISLQLPHHLETVSSTLIRENIDLGRDISHLVDATAQEYIQDGGFYLREPEFKNLVSAGDYRCVTLEHPTQDQWQLLQQVFADVPAYDAGREVTVMHPFGEPTEIVGYLTYQSVSNADLLAVLKNLDQATYVRRHTAGRICLMNRMDVRPNLEREAMEQWLLTETFHHALGQDCSYAVWTGEQEERLDLLERQGFLRCEGYPLMMVDIRAPAVVLQNMVTTLKEPFASSPRVLDAIAKGQKALQRALTALYPGSLVLSLNAEVVHHLMEEKITERNRVPALPTHPRVLGEKMCVPFGKLLRGNAIPNTVTKTIHTSKVFTSDFKDFTIGEFMGYSPLESQMRAIRSFGREVILVDDLLHTGHRMETIGPLCKQEGVDVDMVLVGLLSGRGRDLMIDLNQAIDSVYFVPNLRSWFVESTMYPFIGGDAVADTISFVSGLTPAVNMILPYAYPKMYYGCDKQAVFQFSKTCLENARDIVQALEEEYRQRYARNLNLSHLGEAVILPMSPDKGNCLHYDALTVASTCIDNDLQLLSRMERILE